MLEPLESRLLFSRPTLLRIMPLGDSITEAFSPLSSYRYWLSNALRSRNFNFDFVGSMTGVSGGSAARPDFDQNHEGHVGWRADELAAQTLGWSSTYRPDVVLLHAGTNDLFQGQSVSSTITDLGTIIDRLRQSSPNVTILMAQIIPNTTNPTQITQLNSQIATLALQKNTSQSRVISVDQWTGFNVASDTYDNIHPNEAGELKMANKWFGAVVGAVPAPMRTVAPYRLSSYNWTTVSNGFGPVESNRSNGESALGDGGVLRLNGVSFSHGLGAHANSDITYDLGGHFYTFGSSIGVDDEITSGGSVIFRVYTDGNLRYDSGVMTATSATQTISLDITGVQTLRLQVTDAGNGNVNDHADWANPLLGRLHVLSPPTTYTPLDAPSWARESALPSDEVRDWENTPIADQLFESF